MSKSKQVSKDREILALKPAGKRYEVSVSDARGLTISPDFSNLAVSGRDFR